MKINYFHTLKLPTSKVNPILWDKTNITLIFFFKTNLFLNLIFKFSFSATISAISNAKKITFKYLAKETLSLSTHNHSIKKIKKLITVIKGAYRVKVLKGSVQRR